MPETFESDPEWLRILTQGHRPVLLLRSVMKHLPAEPRCKVCSSPFAGVGGKVSGLLGFKPSRKNPYLCGHCIDSMHPGGALVDIGVLFVDMRGSTALGEKMGAGHFAQLLNRFYHLATNTLLEHDAIIDKLIGDEVMALFFLGTAGPDYRRRAVEAGEDLLRAVKDKATGTAWLAIGVAVHAGEAFVGNVGGDGVSDFTALGDTVNTAARLQSLASAGQLVLSDDLYGEVASRYPGVEAQDSVLRGKDEPVRVRILQPPD
jgi:adenylate cyclase